MALPGWSSLSSVIEIHARLEGIAVLFFVALVVFDVLAHLNKKHETLLERIALVCFGIAVLAEVCGYPYSRRIDTLSNEANVATESKIAALNKEAGDARQKAGEADERAGKAAERAAKADERASANEKEAGRLRSENLDRQSEILKLRQKMADRHLSKEQQISLAKKLMAFPEKDKHINFFRVTGDSEINGIAGEVTLAFGLARWQSASTIGQDSNLTGSGIILQVIDQDSTGRAVAIQLIKILQDAGLATFGPFAEDRGIITGYGGVDPQAKVRLVFSKKP